MNTIYEYVNQFEGIKREWLEKLVIFMREETQLQECFDYKMPTYKGHNFYIAFAAQKNYFSFYTDEVRVLEIFKAEMPSTSLGKSCARIKYKERDAVNVMMHIIKEIEMNTEKETIYDIFLTYSYRELKELFKKSKTREEQYFYMNLANVVLQRE